MSSALRAEKVVPRLGMEAGRIGMESALWKNPGEPI
jgi:hypothetical protein